MAPQAPVTAAVIGLGIMGRRMVEHMRRHEGWTPALLWDPSPEACAEALKVAPEATIAQSPEAAIAGADLVYLACPPAPRKALALAAAAAGKAVFLEKPLGVDVAESEDLVARLAAAGVPAAVNFTQAAGPAMTSVVAAAKSGALGPLRGADIVVTYAHWPRAWQKAADWLRFRAEGGFTREVISHFLFFAERALGPLRVVHAAPSYPADPALCETHVLARLETAEGLPVTILGAVGGAQPDRQELTIKGEAESRLVAEFYKEAASTGGPFAPVRPEPADPRAESLRCQLDDLLLLMQGAPNRLATPEEALRIQRLVETILAA